MVNVRREYHRAWRLANPSKVKRNKRNAHLKHKYGINIEDYDRMLEEQGGVCAMCGTDEPGGGKLYFAVDHDHETGVVRGLLCATCNRFLGHYEKLGELAKRYLSG